MKLRWRVRAERQFKSQLEYLRKANPVAMKRMRARVKQRLSRLLRFPETGCPTDMPYVYELIISGTPFVAVYQLEVMPSQSSAYFTRVRTVDTRGCATLRSRCFAPAEAPIA